MEEHKLLHFMHRRRQVVQRFYGTKGPHGHFDEHGIPKGRPFGI